MTIEPLKQNLSQMKEVLREIYVFTNQFSNIHKLEDERQIIIDNKEKKLLTDAIQSLTNQTRILNNSIPHLLDSIGFYKKLPEGNNPKGKLIQVSYTSPHINQRVSFVISNLDKKDFLENLSKSNLSISQLKKDYSVEKQMPEFGRPNFYAKLSNKFFKWISIPMVNKGEFEKLNKDLRRMNSPFVTATYVSMILFTSFIALFFASIIFAILLFLDISVLYPFISSTNQTIIARVIKFFWIPIFFPILILIIMYIYPSLEAKSRGSKINQELPFVVIHMSAIATSGVEPMSIFKIITKSSEYKFTNMEFRKLMNLINFHGKDIITALRTIAKTSPSDKLNELLEGLATTLNSGGDMHDFLDKHSETLLFDYKLERERYTKASETFMDIYISIVIAAPMILLLLFVIMGSTGTLMSFLGLSVEALSLLIILAIVVLNIGFLFFLRIKQPIL